MSRLYLPTTLTNPLPRPDPKDFMRGVRPPRIVYCARDENRLDLILSRYEPNAVENYLEQLYLKQQHLFCGHYHIVFVWTYQRKIYVDVWEMDLQNVCPQSGAFGTVHTFCDLKTCPGAVISDDTVAVLHFEAVLRKRLKTANPALTVEQYADREKHLPDLGPDMLWHEPFYLP